MELIDIVLEFDSEISPEEVVVRLNENREEAVSIERVKTLLQFLRAHPLISTYQATGS